MNRRIQHRGDAERREVAFAELDQARVFHRVIGDDEIRPLVEGFEIRGKILRLQTQRIEVKAVF